MSTLWKTRKQKGRVSYGQRWFRMESWASRLHTARCWCTCGNGCCLSTCSRTLCGAQISTPPSPPAFYFGSIKGKRQQEGGRLMRKVEAFITAKDTDLHFSFPMMKWVDMDRDGHWPSLWPQTILLCQTDITLAAHNSQSKQGNEFNLLASTHLWVTTLPLWRPNEVNIISYKTNVQKMKKSTAWVWVH